ncbi:hypothetical protein QBC34DRAFT_440378 [Podospora aff. communis PSN243]|uniref:C2H2-type domain-containing protein n=1 Tax=Podospora aff. communis PSN243 TaxID=3040156 RepID=A0AAV9GFA6_9PEZI|nr:hypothetical protein QBC34DRAFT_440378 [Podospora aff. communis PSN243]
MSGLAGDNPMDGQPGDGPNPNRQPLTNNNNDLDTSGVNMQLITTIEIVGESSTSSTAPLFPHGAAPDGTTSGPVTPATDGTPSTALVPSTHDSHNRIVHCTHPGCNWQGQGGLTRHLAAKHGERKRFICLFALDENNSGNCPAPFHRDDEATMDDHLATHHGYYRDNKYGQRYSRTENESHIRRLSKGVLITFIAEERNIVNGHLATLNSLEQERQTIDPLFTLQTAYEDVDNLDRTVPTTNPLDGGARKDDLVMQLVRLRVQSKRLAEAIGAVRAYGEEKKTAELTDQYEGEQWELEQHWGVTLGGPSTSTQTGADATQTSLALPTQQQLESQQLPTIPGQNKFFGDLSMFAPEATWNPPTLSHSDPTTSHALTQFPSFTMFGSPTTTAPNMNPSLSAYLNAQAAPTPPQTHVPTQEPPTQAPVPVQIPLHFQGLGIPMHGSWTMVDNASATLPSDSAIVSDAAPAFYEDDIDARTIVARNQARLEEHPELATATPQVPLAGSGQAEGGGSTNDEVVTMETGENGKEKHSDAMEGMKKAE